MVQSLPLGHRAGDRGLIYWVVSLIPLAAPFQQIIKVIFIIIAVILVLAFLLPLAGLHL